MTRPLAGLRVLDLSRVLSGPSCGKALADLGAEVIKVEPPEGDLTRTAVPRAAGVAVYFAQQNCGKRCVSIDLTHADGSAVGLELAARCDIVLENFRPGVTDRLGIGYEAVRGRNPGVIYCSITGYGQEGPNANRRAYAPVIHAELGLMELTARRSGNPIRPEAVSYADLYSGLQATIAILAALHHRDLTGEGQHIDVSMAEVMLQATEWTAVELAGGEGEQLHVFGGGNAPVLTLGDGTSACIPGNPVSTFPSFCTAMERPDLLEDERFATREARHANQEAVMAVLREWAATFDSFDAFESAAGAARMAVGKVKSLTDAVGEEWAVAREALVDVGDEASGPVILPRGPFRFSTMSAGVEGRPAWQGEHNREVLATLLGLSDADIDKLAAAAVLHERPPT